jgi:dihydrofolate reductase
MGKVIVGTTMSLDGCISDAEGGVGALYPDFEAMRTSEVVQDSMRTTGAVVMGRRTFAMGDPEEYADSYEYQVPIFVVTHTPPAKAPKQNDRLTFTFVTDGAASALRQARAAAGDRDVMVIGGREVAHQCLRTGLVDELELGVAPVLLGGGLRFFEGLDPAIKFETVRVRPEPGMTNFTLRVIGPQAG